MRLIGISDLHLSSKTVLGRPRLSVGAQFLADLIVLAKQHGVSQIAFLGDTVDSKTDMQALLLLHRFLGAVKKNGIDVILLGGNHENVLRSDPANSVLALLDGMADVILLPQIRRFPYVTVFCAPWAREETFIGNAEKLAAVAAQTPGHKILLAHVGLKEGRINASNIEIPRRVSVKHLHADLYDLVLLGDYHVHQQVASNVYYLGAPYQHQFGDEGTVGPWLVDTDDGSMEALDLPNPAPSFRQWRMDVDLVEGDFNVRDYHRIYTTAQLAERVRLRYPDADVRLIGDEEPETAPDLSGSRLSAQANLDPTTLLDRYLTAMGAAERHDALFMTGCELLEEAGRL